MRLSIGIGVLLVFTCMSVEAQFNFTAGYRLAFTNPEVFNQIIEEHNSLVENNEDIKYREDGFKEIRYLNGVDVGMRYVLDGVIFNASWRNKRNSIHADGQYLNSNGDFINRITLSIHEITAGIEPTIGKVSFGATLGYNWLKLKTRFEEDLTGGRGFDGKHGGNTWSSHFSFSFNLSNQGKIGVTIQPYAHVYWGEFDLTGFNNEINNQSLDAGTLKDKFNTFGIAFIINNGRQPY